MKAKHPSYGAHYMVSFLLVLACGEVYVTPFRVVALYFWCSCSHNVFGTWFKPTTNK